VKTGADIPLRRRGPVDQHTRGAAAGSDALLTEYWLITKRGSVYCGGANINAVTCVPAAMDLARTLRWFAASIRDIRTLRIEESNDLMLAGRLAAQLGSRRPRAATTAREATRPGQRTRVARGFRSGRWWVSIRSVSIRSRI